ncbi:GrpB family protein [Candidatus Nomurabacteria bacterium]|nr:GrpB family protein [Candidatus Nomurabacteria bacterium]
MNSLGLEEGVVRLVPHDNSWPDLFELEKKKIQEKIREYILAIEHCGSTAIPNIPSKPIMNICIKVDNLEKVFDLKDELFSIGYLHKPESNFGDHELFFKKENRKVTHHLHFMSADGDNWQKATLFRKYLLENPEMAQVYGELKTNLANRFPNDRKAYGEGKNEFINKVLNIIM